MSTVDLYTSLDGLWEVFQENHRKHNDKGNKAVMTMQYPGDAGNKATVCFLCESALALLLDSNRLPEYSGFLTPVIAFDGVLFERMVAAELQMTCEPIER